MKNIAVLICFFALTSCMTSEGVSTTKNVFDTTSHVVGTTADATSSTSDASSGDDGKAEQYWEYEE